MAAESIYGGTWASGLPPEELIDFEIMRYMHWSWSDLQGCPPYMRAVIRDLMRIRPQNE